MPEKKINIDSLIELAVWNHLDDKKDLELLLLKGHLLLETILETALSRKNIAKIDKYSFYTKVQKFKKIECDNLERRDFISISLEDLNKMRNKLAHQSHYEVNDGIELWAKKILDNLNGTKYSRYSFRTRIVHSFSVISVNILELTNEKTSADI